MDGIHNFLHFTLGYLIPALSIILEQEDHRKGKYYVQSSTSSALNRNLKDIYDLFNFDYTIVEQKPDDVKVILVPRWDQAYSYHSAFLEAKYWLIIKDFIKEILVNHRMPKLLMYFTYQRRMKTIYRRLQSIFKSNGLYNPNRKSAEYLLIKRTGAGEEKSSLLKMDETINEFLGQGLNVKIFQPGKYDILTQIKYFLNCSGIITLRGAELANVMWMREKSHVFILHNRNYTLPLLVRSLINLLQIKLTAFEEHRGMFLELSQQTIQAIINKVQRANETSEEFS